MYERTAAGSIRRLSDGAVLGNPSDIAEAMAWEATGNVISPYNPPSLTQDDYAAAIQAHINATAMTRNYDSTLSILSYTDSTVPAWAAEAQAFKVWRDTVLLYAFQQLAAVQGGQRAQPTVAALIAELPAIEWPS